MALAAQSGAQLEALAAEVQVMRALSEKKSATMYWNTQRLLRSIKRARRTKSRLERRLLLQLYNPDQL